MSITSTTIKWDGSSLTWPKCRQDIEINLIMTGVQQLATGETTKPTRKHGERRTLLHYMAVPDPANPDTMIPRIDPTTNEAVTETQAVTQLKDWLVVTGWEARESAYISELAEWEKKRSAFFGIIREKFSTSVITKLGPHILAQDPRATWTAILALAAPNEAQTLGASWDAYNDFQWTPDLATISDVEATLIDLENRINAFPGESLSSEAAFCAKLRSLVTRTHGPIFSETCLSLSRGYANPNYLHPDPAIRAANPHQTLSFSRAKHFEDLKIAESTVAHGQPWIYMKLNPEAYKAAATQRALHDRAVRATYADAITKISYGAIDGAVVEELNSALQASATPSFSNRGQQCGICGGQHLAKNCLTATTCPICGWKHKPGTICPKAWRHEQVLNAKQTNLDKHAAAGGRRQKSNNRGAHFASVPSDDDTAIDNKALLAAVTSMTKQLSDMQKQFNSFEDELSNA